MSRKIGRKPGGEIPVAMERRASGRGLDGRRKSVRVWLSDENSALLDKDAQASFRNRTWQAEILLENALHSSWAYSVTPGRYRPSIESARDFFAALQETQERARGAAQEARDAAEEGMLRCQRWLDVEKAKRTTKAAASSAPKVVEGRFAPPRDEGQS